MNPNAAEAAKAAKAAKAAATVKNYNDFLQKWSGKLNTVTVTELMFENTHTRSCVFKGVDSTDPENPKPIIVKTTKAPWDNQVELPHLQPYVRLSEHCNICKLLKYEVIGPPSNRKLVTVMENCGVDLFNFMDEFLKNENGINRILSISLDLLNQIICLQRHNAVHGDIKIENVLIDDTGKATLVDFDELPTITQDDATGKVHVSELTVTQYRSEDDTYMKRAVNYYKTNDTEKQFTMAILSLPDPDLVNLYMECNIPMKINEIRRENSNNFTLPNREHVNIIDLYSWCYVILIMLWVVRKQNDYVLGYRTLLAIIMSIILPNADPQPEPVDVFDIPINAEYRRRLVLGITVLLSEGTVIVTNEACTNNKVRLFLKLIQRCDTAEELSARFKSIVDANTEFYNTNTDDGEFEKNQIAFNEIDAHISASMSAPAPSMSAPPGGRRRRRTHKKTKTKCKKGKGASKFKRMTRRVR
jgi:serine/threonine protein kinase